MQIVDIHTHIYPRVAGITQGQPMRSETLGRVRVGNRLKQFLPPSFEQSDSKLETLIAYMDWCGIGKAVLMANPYYGYYNDYFIEAVRRYPHRLKGVAVVDPLKGEEAARELADIYDKGELFGFKMETDSAFQCAPGACMSDERLIPVWDCINQYSQPVFLHLFTDQDVHDLIMLTKRYPQILFVVCHMGADACFGGGKIGENYSKVLDLVKTNSRVYIDTSTVPVYFHEEYPWKTSVQVIETAYELVGPEKMMWASDYPGMLNHGTMGELINLVVNGCSKIPGHHKELIMGKNADLLFFQ